MNIRSLVDIQDVSIGTEIFVDQNSINIYPNPSDQFVQIEGLLSTYNLSILDVSGTIYKTLQSTSNILTVDRRALPAGIFFISIYHKSNHNLSRVKMIKQ